MEKKQIHKLDQHEKLQLQQYIDWSMISYEDGVSSEEEGPTELVSKWIIRKKRKFPPQDHQDQ